MATGGENSINNKIETSDITYEFSCSNCNDTGENTKAIYKCVNCETFLCVTCCDGHNKFVKGHTIVDFDAKDKGWNVKNSSIFTCEEHEGKSFDVYCKWHDTVCCSVCLLDHK